MRSLLACCLVTLCAVASARAATDGQAASASPQLPQASPWGTAPAPRRQQVLGSLGSYQENALLRVLEERGLEIELHPEGKRVAGVLVKNFDVFSREEDGRVLGWLNFFHMTTREHIIAREVLLQPGDLWDPVVAQETRRRLTEPLFSAFVVVAPVKAPTPGEVFVLVVTRDIFSLRLNTNFEFQGNVLSLLHIEPAENNFLGRRKRVAGDLEITLGRYALGPTYFDSNIAGSRWQLLALARAYVGREEQTWEGRRLYAKLEHPLWAFSRRWGAVFSLDQYEATERSFLGAGLRAYDDPNTTAVEAVPWRYRYRTLSVDTRITRQSGTHVIKQVSLGYDFDLRRPEVFDALFVEAPALRAAFARDVLPRSERVSAPLVAYRMFTPNYVTFHDYDTFDLPEDVRLGPELALSAARALPALGADRSFWRLTGSVKFVSRLGKNGLWSAELEGSTRRLADSWVDNQVRGGLLLATPLLFEAGRVVLRLRADRLIENRAVRNVALGGDSGLRGYPIGAFLGQALAVGNLEVRTRGMRVSFMRLGVAAFWDFGHVAARFSDLVLHHDVGAGLRLLIPQLQPTVIRADWAFATQGPTAGLPGRFSAGFTQAF